MSDNGWFAEFDDTVGRWIPVIQIDGTCFSIDIWFKTEMECLEWLRCEIIGSIFNLEAQRKVSENMEP
jgi:hypothetical protein